MEIITDHNILLKTFHETQNELDELELKSNRILHRYSRWKDANFSQGYGKDPSFSSIKHLLPKESPTKQLKHDHSSDSSEESTWEDEPPNKKVSLQSAVITIKAESRKNVIFKQNINKKVQSRNRRILGMLQSTLQKFQDDAVKRQPQDLKRIKVEEKVEAAKDNEKQRMEKEETELYLKINEKKLRLDCLEQMMSITESFQTWKCNKKRSLNFILTKAEPRICYLPVSHTLSTRKELKKSRLKTLRIIENEEKVLKEELAEIKDSFEAKSSQYYG